MNLKPISDKKGQASTSNTFKMHLHLVLLLFGSGVSSYFLPLKGMRHLQNKTQYTIIDEMLCLLEAENESIEVNNFPLPSPQICLLELISSL